MKLTPRSWRRIASRINVSQRAQRNQHDAAEHVFWQRQIRAAWWLNGITLFAAIIALSTIIVLIFTLIDARKATVEANRAWVAPRSAYLTQPFVLNEHPVFRVTFDNVGKEPAPNIQTWWLVKIVDANLLVPSLKEPNLFESAFGKNQACDGHTSREAGETLWPSEKLESYTQFYVPNPNDPVITQEVLDGRAAVVVQGCVLYETFNKLHQSAFCFWFRQVPPTMTISHSAMICPIGNDAN
jgi:hypothetical protein